MLSESEQSAIMRSLEKILADDKFSGSPQMSAFLRYVVTETLRGNSERIKAYAVAVDALGKSESFDPQNDPSVRVLAKRLRTCLGQYYERTDNHEKIIELRPGSYVPIFSDPDDDSGRPTPVTRELLVSRATQDSVNPTVSATPDRAGVKPEIANSVSAKLGASERASELAALGDSAIDAVTSPAFDPQDVLQNTDVGVLKKSEKQQADALLSGTSAKEQKKYYAPIQNIRSMVASFFDTGQMHKSLYGGLLLVTLVTVMWGFNKAALETGTTQAALANTQDNYALQLASANITQASRQRPAVPTVIVRSESREDTISKSLLSSISHVLSKFDHVQVLNSTQEYELTQKWPEDYEIVVDTLIMNDSKKITATLINAASGRIAYSDELVLGADDLNGGVSASFTKSNIAALEVFVARIVQKNGPLLLDYKNQEEYSETMACVFSITASNTKDDCLNKVIAQGHSETIQQTLRAELGLVQLAKMGGSNRKAALKNTLAAAQKNLELAPHSADAHALMMRVFHLSGDYSKALKHGNHAMDINELNSNNMFALAVLLDEIKKPVEAANMRKQANVLSITLSDTSL